MIAQELINHMIPPLKLSDDAHKAMLWMEELRSNELPVVDNEQFKGIITEDMILEENVIDKLIADFQLKNSDCVVSVNSHFYEVLRVSGEAGAKLIGVVDEADKYVGVITVQDTVSAFAQSAAVQMPGGILVISLQSIDYSLAEIARLVEENNAKILSSSIKQDDANHNMMRLTLKINKLDLTSIMATLERFGYRIIAHFQESKVSDDQRDRLDMLLKYLNI